MLYTLSSVDTETALNMAQHVLSGARTEGLAVAVSVVDVAGHPLALLRMDGVAATVADFAQDKAFTAVMMRKSTAAFGDRMDSVPSLRLGLATRARLLTWGGGLPLYAEGRIVGGIGVSGAQDFQDIALATEAATQAGLAVSA